MFPKVKGTEGEVRDTVVFLAVSDSLVFLKVRILTRFKAG